MLSLSLNRTSRVTSHRYNEANKDFLLLRTIWMNLLLYSTILNLYRELFVTTPVVPLRVQCVEKKLMLRGVSIKVTS